ncbi:aldo/keto reductase [Pseudonocardia nematodicida]|uniref:Aldo/keto reductase n=1 Tax=Pseudonocardia nematodicida TaxID=1206997 RepID=A0ABV1KE97_9PSEU
MKSTVLGRPGAGLEVPVVGLGCMRMGLQGVAGEAERAHRTIRRALDAGVTFLDTADMYVRGVNEEIVGAAIAGRRDEVQLATKFGVVRGDGDEFSLRGDAAYARPACEASLRRLGVDVIDLYYLHRRDPEVPIEESVGAMAELVAAGKVRHIGLSEVTGQELRAAHSVHPVTALQSQWSVAAREVEEVVPVCAELGIGVVPWSPQAQGTLSATDDSRDAEFDTTFPGDPGLPGRVRALAARLSLPPAAITHAWISARSRHWGVPVAPVFGTTTPERIDELVAGAAVTVPDELLDELDPVAPRPAPAHR